MPAETNIKKPDGLSLHQERVLLRLGNELARGEHPILVLRINDKGELHEEVSGIVVKKQSGQKRRPQL